MAMGIELGHSFFALYKEVVWVHAKWQQYRVLFGSSSDQVALLNRTAGFFFKLVQDATWEDVLIHVARLTDPSASFGRRNLTIQMLPPMIRDVPLRGEVETLMNECLEKAKHAREHRNKRLAHRDLIHATEPIAAPLREISRAHVEDVLLSFRALMNRIDLHYLDTTVMYEQFIAHSGAESLVSALRRAEREKKTSAQSSGAN